MQRSSLFYQQLLYYHFFFFLKFKIHDDNDRLLKCVIFFLLISCFKQVKFFVHNFSHAIEYRNQSITFFMN